MNAGGSKSLHRREQTWVCVVAALFLCDFIVCGYLPSQQRLSSVRQAQAQQQQTINMAAAQGVELARRLVERFDASVPPDRALGDFLKRVADVMVTCNLTDPEVLPGKEFSAGDLGCIPVHLTWHGTLSQVFGFFNRLQTLDRLVRIETMMLQNDAEFTGQLKLEADVVIFHQSGRFKSDKTAPAQSADEVSHGA